MNAAVNTLPVITQIHRADLPAIGAPLGGGFFTAIYRCGDTTRALISAPKAEGERERVIWLPERKLIAGAMSFTDGLANTRAMAEASSELAKDFLALRIGGADDWCLPALDQGELQYRAFKPTAEENYCGDGCNINAIPPTQRYSLDFPTQTGIALFREGGAEAFETDDAYWTSTQFAGHPGCAWGQDFNGGYQTVWDKDGTCRARAVRSILVIE